MTAKNCYIQAILLLMVVESLQVFPTLCVLDAFRMVRYEYHPARKLSSHDVKYNNNNSNNNKCNALFATQNDEDNQQLIQQQQQQQLDPFQATGQDDLFKTLAGGPALIFEMARKSMLFATKDTDNSKQQPTNSMMTTTTTTPFDADRQQPAPTQGRWYPHSGIADDNPNFRTQAPTMTNKGFAKSIWKNARKRNKPSLWKHSLRTYDRMALLEGDSNFVQIQRSNIHHEGAMQACAKLGLWQRALEIYHYVYEQEIGEERQSQRILQSDSPSSSPPQEQEQQQEYQAIELKRQQISPSSSRNNNNNIIRKRERSKKRTSVYVTDDMVLSLVRATVRASRLRSRQKRKSHDPPLSSDQEEQEAALRRIPLDTALEILSTMPEDHNIPLVAYYFNPLAAAYQTLGYTAFSKEILETMLSNRTAGEDDILNVHDLCAKDKGSYSLLVQASVVTGDWGSAVDSLSEMTNAGIYPNPRHCNVWSEISERQTRPRAVGSWKKKRDDYWTDSVR